VSFGLIPRVYEGSSRLGGRVRSATGLVAPGLVTELGAEFINTDHNDMLDLAADFGLSLFDRNTYVRRLGLPRTIYAPGGIPITEAALAEKLRPLARRVALDSTAIANDEATAAAIDALTVVQYLDRVPNLDPIARRLAEATIRSEYGVEPAQSSAMQLIFNALEVRGQNVDLIAASDERLSIEGGNARLIAGMGGALAGLIETRRILAGLATGPDGATRLLFTEGASTLADIVILALPATKMRELDLRIPIPPALRAQIAGAQLGRNEKVIARFDGRPWVERCAFAGEIWAAGGFSEAWDSTFGQAGPVSALSFYLGGLETPAAATPAASARRFTALVEPSVPGLAARATGAAAATAWGADPFVRGAYSTFAPGQLTNPDRQTWTETPSGAVASTVQAGRVFFVGEHLSDDWYGFMNGAAQTGRLAAQAVRDQIASA
jgi:monoamine oxidase